MTSMTCFFCSVALYFVVFVFLFEDLVVVVLV